MAFQVYSVVMGLFAQYHPLRSPTQGAEEPQFPEVPTVEWAVFINNNRWKDNPDIESLEYNGDGKYDIVIGSVADDRIALTIYNVM